MAFALFYLDEVETDVEEAKIGTKHKRKDWKSSLQ